MKRRVLLVDDEVAVLLTLKAVLEINGFDVETAASGREGRLKVRSHEYDMIITDLRMESDQAGAEVISAARSAAYQPAIALITAFPLADEDWQEMGADHMLVKPMHTRRLLEQIDQLLESHTRRLARKAPGSSPAALQPKLVAKQVTKKLPPKKPLKSTKPVAAERKPRASRPATRLRSKA